MLCYPSCQIREIIGSALAHVASNLEVLDLGFLHEGHIDNLVTISEEENKDDTLEQAEANDEDVQLEDKVAKLEVGFNVGAMVDDLGKGDPYLIILCD
jgi:hypothetical protein